MQSARAVRIASCGCCTLRKPAASTSAHRRLVKLPRRHATALLRQEAPTSPRANGLAHLASIEERNEAARAAVEEHQRSPALFESEEYGLSPGTLVDSRSFGHTSLLVFLKPSVRNGHGIFMDIRGRIVVVRYSSVVIRCDRTFIRSATKHAVRVGATVQEAGAGSGFSLLEYQQTGLHEAAQIVPDNDAYMGTSSSDIASRQMLVQVLRLYTFSLQNAPRAPWLQRAYTGISDQAIKKDASRTFGKPGRFYGIWQFRVARPWQHPHHKRDVLADEDHFVADADVGQTDVFYLRLPQQLADLEKVRSWLRDGSPELDAFLENVRESKTVDDAEGKRIIEVLWQSLSDDGQLQSSASVEAAGTILKLAGLSTGHLANDVLEVLTRVDGLKEGVNTVLLDPRGPVAGWQLRAQPRVLASENVELASTLHQHDPLRKLRHSFDNAPIYAVDAPDANELDDALSCEVVEDGTTWIHAHIADPAALIPQLHGIALSAWWRLESLYGPLPHPHPMLGVSDEVAASVSLNGENAQRTMVFSARLDKEGELLEYNVRPGLSSGLLVTTYATVNALLKGKAPPKVESTRNLDALPDQAAADFTLMAGLAKKLFARRVAAGMMVAQPPIVNFPPDAHEPQPKISLVDEGESSGLSRISAELLVAEMMILANRVAARFCAERNIPVLYRTIRPPVPGTPAAKAIEYLRAVRDGDTGEVPWREALLADSLREPATFSVRPSPHLGLGIVKPQDGGYLQVTSPLRRYADLYAHYQMHSYFLGELDAGPKMAAKHMCDDITARLPGRRRFVRRLEAYGQLSRLSAHVGLDKPAQEAIITRPAHWNPVEASMMARVMLPKLGGVTARMRVEQRDPDRQALAKELSVGKDVTVKLERVELGMSPTLHAILA